jgi:hypothetical protein
MLEPGLLDGLGGEGRAAWTEKVRRIAARAVDARPGTHFSADAELPHVVTTDWPGLPTRIVRCLGRETALDVLDRDGGAGRTLQEEYLEWRTVRDDDGVVVRVEFTSELGAYWRTLAAHRPRALLDTVACFAREDDVPAETVYGVRDPSALSPADRELAFARTTLDPGGARSPYNTGERAICCMIQPSNTLTALIHLAAAASRPQTIGADARRALDAGDLVAAFGDGATAGRASDPLLIERLARAAWDGRRIAAHDPLGVYIIGAERGRLRTRDGEVVPADWWTFSRGRSAADSPDGRALHQRLVLEAPQGAGIRLGDLVDAATEESISSGAQVADLVQMAAYLRVGDAGAVEPRPHDAGEVSPAQPECADLRAAVSS